MGLNQPVRGAFYRVSVGWRGRIGLFVAQFLVVRCLSLFLLQGGCCGTKLAEHFLDGRADAGVGVQVKASDDADAFEPTLVDELDVRLARGETEEGVMVNHFARFDLKVKKLCVELIFHDVVSCSCS